MKGEEKLWNILNEKLDTLRASNRLPEAIRVAETVLDLAKRTFDETQTPLALSFEKLGQLLDQSGDRAGWPFLAIILANLRRRFVITRRPLPPEPNWKICLIRISAQC
jgi:hypothetical protein